MAKLTLKDKLEVIEEAKCAESYGPVCAKWNIVKSAITYLLSQEENYKKIVENGMNINMKRIPKDTVLNADLEVKGFVNQMEKGIFQYREVILKHKDTYSSNGVENFIGSPGYIQKLKKRINTKRRLLYGEANSVDEVALRKWELESLDIVSEYGPGDIFNCDEAGLVCKFLKQSTYLIEDKENCDPMKKRGTKRDKSRMTVMCTCSSLGEKRKLVIIGHNESLRNFKNFGNNHANWPFDYYFNKIAWMNGVIFIDIIQKWDDELKLSGRKVLLLLDNFTGHYIDYEPENIKLLYLRPNSTALSQPLDAGIIKKFKDKYMYNKKVLEYVYDYSRTDRSVNGTDIMKTLSVYRAVLFASLAWDEVDSKIIVNCWNHTALTSDSSHDVSFDHTYGQ